MVLVAGPPDLREATGAQTRFIHITLLQEFSFFCGAPLPHHYTLKSVGNPQHVWAPGSQMKHLGGWVHWRREPGTEMMYVGYHAVPPTCSDCPFRRHWLPLNCHLLIFLLPGL